MTKFDDSLEALKASPAYDPVNDEITLTREEWNRYQFYLVTGDSEGACALMDWITLRSHAEADQ